MSKTDYEDDGVIQELQDELYGRSYGGDTGNAWSSLSREVKIMAGLAIGILIFMVYRETIPLKDALLYAAIGIIVLYFLIPRETTRRELSWIECIVRIENLLRFLQKHPIGDYPQVPKGKIKVSPIGRKQYYEGKPFKRSFRVEIYDEAADVEEIYFVEVDVFSGDIITFRYSPEGVYGDETKDIKFIPHFDAMMQKKRDQYLGKNKRS